MTDPGWMLDIGPTHSHGQGNRCGHCPHPITGEWVRLTAGMVLGAGSAQPVTVPVNVNLHDGCHAAYMVAHYPWLCDIRTREVA